MSEGTSHATPEGGMQALRRVTAKTPGKPLELNGRRKVIDREKGLVEIEGIAVDAAENAVAAQADHVARVGG
ncbi:hypothetical protein [Nocardioides sp. GY 10127]|uniref:hypothetical protein n=1 Tax=Nocardioides sp. GY 10127 TaxID=2569762 RepID=UPI0010A8109A|nr:hypothetical protein [Nocardioides sp. GY 10127]TIC84110.1 hypothetical protein E8D37_04695 [Nocardioides sp. GY 10127]